LPVSLP
jgi:hypothetical protein